MRTQDRGECGIVQPPALVVDGLVPRPSGGWGAVGRLLRFAHTSAVSAFLSSELIAMVAGGRPARHSSMNPRTRYWIVHWLDALTWPASLVLKGVRTTTQTVGRVIIRRRA
jgi:hypothetical protein